MSWITDIFSTGATSLVDSVSGLLGKVVTTKGEKIQLDNELKKAQMQYNEDLAKLSVEEQQLYLQDTANARDMNAKIEGSPTASWMSKNMPYIYDIFILVIWGSMTIYIILRWLGYIETTNKNLDMTGVLGIYSGVTALATMIIQFHRGSSQGSKDKTEIIKNMNQQNSQ
jgi:hypothetical protein